MLRKLFVLTFFNSSWLCAAPAFQAVNLNAASKEQIMVLPGVGEKLAQRIVAQRDEKGQFASLDELLLIKGLHPKLLGELTGKIEVGKARKAASLGKATKEPSETPKKLSEQEIAERMAEFSQEPKAKEVQEQALKYASAEPSKVDEWLRRARLAPAFPSLSVSTGKGSDSDASIKEKLGDANVVLKKDSSDFNINVKLEWKLGDLLFNRNELYVARESFRMAVIRERILTDVTKAYMERKRAQLKALTSEGMQPLERAENSLRMEELTAILDGLTGGWFSEKISNS